MSYWSRKFGRLLLFFVPFAFLGVPTCEDYYMQQLARERALSQYAVEETPAVQPAAQFGGYSLSDLAAEDRCTTLLEGSPRGLACLHCMQPEARSQAKILTTLLYRSCLKNVAMNFLVDGTFSYDAEFLTDQISLLSANGRRLFLHFYLTNGSTQRRWKETQIYALGTKTSPEDFRENIRHNPLFQKEYQRLALRLLPVLRFASERGAVLSMVPALEDNLDDESFGIMLGLAKAVLPSELNIHYGRSACEGCYAGNTSSLPAGVFEEMHTVSAYAHVRHGLITNDGTGYRFEDEDDYEDDGFSSREALTLWDLAPLRDRASDLESIFILWSASRQGLPVNRDGVSSFLDPEEREYEVPSIKEREALLEFLRNGYR